MKVKKSVVIQKMGDTLVAYDNDTSTLHQFNEVGFLILEGLSRGKSKKKIIQSIASRFRVTQREAEGDFKGFVAELKAKDLIERKI